MIRYQLVRAGMKSTYSRFCGRILLVCVASFFFKIVRFLSINGAEEVGAQGFLQSTALPPSAQMPTVAPPSPRIERCSPGALVRLSSISKQQNM